MAFNGEAIGASGATHLHYGDLVLIVDAERGAVLFTDGVLDRPLMAELLEPQAPLVASWPWASWALPALGVCVCVWGGELRCAKAMTQRGYRAFALRILCESKGNAEAGRVP